MTNSLILKQKLGVSIVSYKLFKGKDEDHHRSEKGKLFFFNSVLEEKDY